jgi:hypothetical protein
MQIFLKLNSKEKLTKRKKKKKNRKNENERKKRTTRLQIYLKCFQMFSKHLQLMYSKLFRTLWQWAWAAALECSEDLTQVEE